MKITNDINTLTTTLGKLSALMRLADAFHPDAIQRKRAMEIQKTRPQKIKD